MYPKIFNLCIKVPVIKGRRYNALYKSLRMVFQKLCENYTAADMSAYIKRSY